MEIRYSEKLRKLPPYLFAEIDEIKEKLISEGKDIIDMSVGDPDIPTPEAIVNRMKECVEEPKNHQYPFGKGLIQFREAVAKWYKNRFDVQLDPATEVLALIGSKEGIGHIPVAFVDPGDVVLVPNPSYPVYPASVLLAGGDPYYMPLLPDNDFLPRLENIPNKTADRAKFMFLNYPNNPTAAVAGEEYYKEVVDFAKKTKTMVFHDAAYTEVYYDGYKPVSFMQLPGAKDVGVEFHSLSKTFNMTGWRIGFVVGNKDILAGLAKVKSNIDSGVFRAVQCAGTLALESEYKKMKETLDVFKQRRDLLVDGLMEMGWNVSRPKATFYLWVPVPPGRTSRELAMWLLENTQIIVTPGNGFGKYGEGFIRFSLTVPAERIKEAIERMRKASPHSG